MNLNKLINFGILCALFAGLNLLAEKLDLYWILWWYDSMMHTLAGVVIASAVYILVSWDKNKTVEKSKLLISIISATLIIGLVWEYFEVTFGITFMDVVGYKSDTVSDLIYDILGAFLFYLYAVNNLLSDRIKK